MSSTRINQFRFMGYKPSVRAAQFQFGTYAKLADITLPRSFGHIKESIPYGMLGNDTAGNCVICDLCHAIMVRATATARPLPPFTALSAIGIYSQMTGYDPTRTDIYGNNPTDNGTDMRMAASWARQRGIRDASGFNHKIEAYAAIEPGNWDQLIKATYMFGSVSIGVALPQSANDQFEEGVPWTTSGDGKILGGHAITACGRNSAGFLTALTWGRTTAISRPFIERYMQEGIVSFSLEYLATTGLSPELFDAARLRADIASLGALE